MVKFPLTVLGTLKTVLYPYLYNPANLILALTAPDCLNPPESTDWGEDLDPTEREEMTQKLMDIVSDEMMVLKIVNSIALKDSPRTYFGTDFYRYVTVSPNENRFAVPNSLEAFSTAVFKATHKPIRILQTDPVKTCPEWQCPLWDVDSFAVPVAPYSWRE